MEGLLPQCLWVCMILILYCYPSTLPNNIQLRVQQTPAIFSPANTVSQYHKCLLISESRSTLFCTNRVISYRLWLSSGPGWREFYKTASISVVSTWYSGSDTWYFQTESLNKNYTIWNEIFRCVNWYYTMCNIF